MSCCGQKRSALTQSSGSERESTMAADPGSLRMGFKSGTKAATFRYTGANALEISGLFGRNLYRFSAEARELMVVPDDVAIMRAHPELIEIG